jgi:hypothetical protein
MLGAFNSISTVMECFAVNQEARQTQEHAVNLLSEINKMLQIVNNSNSSEIQQAIAPVIGGIFDQVQYYMSLARAPCTLPIPTQTTPQMPTQMPIGQMAPVAFQMALPPQGPVAYAPGAMAFLPGAPFPGAPVVPPNSEEL